jgi:hypothetical protein
VPGVRPDVQPELHRSPGRQQHVGEPRRPADRARRSRSPTLRRACERPRRGPGVPCFGNGWASLSWAARAPLDVRARPAAERLRTRDDDYVAIHCTRPRSSLPTRSPAHRTCGCCSKVVTMTTW